MTKLIRKGVYLDSNGLPTDVKPEPKKVVRDYRKHSEACVRESARNGWGIRAQHLPIGSYVNKTKDGRAVFQTVGWCNVNRKYQIDNVDDISDTRFVEYDKFLYPVILI